MIRTGLFCLVLGSGSASVFAGGLPGPVTDEMYFPLDMAEVRLGHLLFWDPILSGNQNIACVTCHHPRFGTSDGVSLAIGEGGIGLGPERRGDPANMPEQRIPRNAPALFNLGAREFTVLFHDGRIEVDETRASGFRTPLDDDMLVGFESVLSAQSMFPVLSSDEMAGHYSENDVSQAARQGRLTGDNGAWDILAKRVGGIAEYQAMFEVAYPEIAAGRAVGFTDISNAIAAFIGFEWRSDQSAFDVASRGGRALEGAATLGAELFYGEAGCSACHSGAFQTDHRFHAMGVAQIGPGKAAAFESYVGDAGRQKVTGDPADRYAFRTPSLRNVTVTGPYGHDGAYSDLEKFVRAHLDPVSGLESYDRGQVTFPFFDAEQDWAALDDPAEVAAIAGAVEIEPVTLGDEEVAALLAFLAALDDPIVARGRLGVPDAVPSGLAIDR